MSAVFRILETRSDKLRPMIETRSRRPFREAARRLLTITVLIACAATASRAALPSSSPALAFASPPVRGQASQPAYRREFDDDPDPDPTYVRLIVDTPIALRPGDQERIGFLRTGTPLFVDAQASSAKWAAASVAFPPVHPDRALTSYRPGRLEVFLPKQVPAGWAIPPAQRVDPARGEARFGLYREISVTPGGAPFAYLRCGKARIVERRNGYWRVEAEYDDGELWGWIEAPESSLPDEGCDHRSLAFQASTHHVRVDFPHRYLPSLHAAEELARLVARGAQFFWGNGRSEGRACAGWHFVPATGGRSSRIALDESDLPGEVVSLDRGLVVDFDGSAATVADGFVTPRRGERIRGCTHQRYAVVNVTSSRIDLVAWTEPKRLETYHASVRRSWFLSRKVCETAAPGNDPAPCGGWANLAQGRSSLP